MGMDSNASAPLECSPHLTLLHSRWLSRWGGRTERDSRSSGVCTNLLGGAEKRAEVSRRVPLSPGRHERPRFGGAGLGQPPLPNETVPINIVILSE